ncbi:hypothetical protein L596_018994 [Steinernema carpocapsae]|uniref:protein-histidine N-methyltransferase n=1 Tax=Steinernema carpocapsae TaxID=34508 RepID=A0A4U5N6I4_STECR|nr:hypothetical protein L596_018994 [Steinernema carpocapsae]
MYDYELEQRALREAQAQNSSAAISGTAAAPAGDSTTDDDDSAEDDASRLNESREENDDDGEDDDDDDDDDDEDLEDEEGGFNEYFGRGPHDAPGFRLMEALGVGPFNGGFSHLTNSFLAPPSRNRTAIVPDPNHLSWKERVKMFESIEDEYDKIVEYFEHLKTDKECFEVGENKKKFYTLNKKIIKELLMKKASANSAADILLRHLVGCQHKTLRSALAGDGMSDNVISDLKTCISSDQFNVDDVKPGVYEGGLKVWEGELVLANFLVSKECTYAIKGKNVLEVGCGSGLLGVLACKEKCGRLVVHDYSDIVVECYTKSNFYINDINAKLVEYIHGDWQRVARSQRARQYDLILTAETIHSEETYYSLHDLLFKVLKDNGHIYVAGKAEHIGSNESGFLKYVRKEGKFRAEVVWTSLSEDPSYKIMEMRKSPSHKLTTAMRPSKKKMRLAAKARALAAKKEAAEAGTSTVSNSTK